MFCFIDDLCAISDNAFSEKHFKEILPEELELKKENVSNTKVSFLAIDLELKECKIQTIFLIGRTLSHFSLAIYPLKYFVSTGSEILRLARSTSDRL